MKHFLNLSLLVLMLAACSSQPGADNLQPAGGSAGTVGTDGLEARQNTQIPAQYAGFSDPSSADKESLARGASIYATNCASCHGKSGMGDGPVGAALDPAPADLAVSISAVGDDYLFWRISEGSGPFNSAMPAWKAGLAEQSRWDVIHFLRSLEQ